MTTSKEERMKLYEKIKEKAGDKFESIQRTAFKLGVMTAIRDTRSVDPKVLARRICELKDLPEDAIDRVLFIVEKILPLLREEGLLLRDNSLSKLATRRVEDYEKMLQIN